MGSSIHPKTIQEVKEKADIVDVISEHVVLKKKGKEYADYQTILSQIDKELII